MKLFRRITLLGSFAAVGVGIALAVVVATSPSQGTLSADKSDGRPTEERSSHPSWLAESAETRRGCQSPGLVSAVSTAGPVPASGQREIRPPAVRREGIGELAMALPAGPVAAEPHPPVAFQAKPADVEKAIEYLQQHLTPGSGAPPEAVPTPPPSDESVPQSPAAPSTAGKAPTMVRKNRITRVGAGEGDDHLSIHIQDTDLREVLEMLGEEGNLNILASNSVQGKVSATLNDVSIDSAMAAILRSTGYVARRDGKFIYVGKPDDFEAMEQAVDTVGTRVYRPNYLTADELQKLVTPLLTPKVGLCSVSVAAEKGIGSDDNDAGGNQFAGNELILVRDYEAVLAQVDQVIAEVDVRPAQVAIEAMILSVKLTDDDKMGINWQVLRQNPHLKLTIGDPQKGVPIEDDDYSYQNFPTWPANGGLAVAFLDSNLGAFIDALEQLNEVNVIASPRLMVLNKQRAEIQIGREQGYLGGTITTETNTQQPVEFLKTGTILRLRPYIANDGLIRMEVHPELSSGEVVKEDGTALPDKEVTQVTSNVMVANGCTVIIGGLMRNELSNSGSQIPYLGNLPWVGGLFRTRNEGTERHEVLVLITPRIVNDCDSNAEARMAGSEFERRQATYAEKMDVFGKRHVARRYLRMAQEAWACGNRDRALRFAELAVHFDPQSLDAIELRSRIWNNSSGSAALAGAREVPAETVQTPLDGQTMAPWLLEGLENPTAMAPSPQPAAPAPPKYKAIQRPRSLP